MDEPGEPGFSISAARQSCGEERSGQMEPEEFDQLCHALEAGDEKYVENIGSQEKGKVLFCSGNRLEVEVNGKRETWAMDSCQKVD
jgi:hypothetical protein